MSIKTTLIALVISIGSMTAAVAQELPAEVTTAINAALETCSVTPADCAEAMNAVLAAMRDAGLEGQDLDNALIAVAASLTSLGATLPVEAQTAIAAAVQVVADNVSPDGPSIDALNEVIAALQNGLGSSVVAVLDSPN